MSMMYGKKYFLGLDKFEWVEGMGDDKKTYEMFWVSLANARVIVLTYEGKPVYLTEVDTPASNAVAIDEMWKRLAQHEYNEPVTIASSEEEFYALIDQRVKDATIEYIAARME